MRDLQRGDSTRPMQRSIPAITAVAQSYGVSVDEVIRQLTAAALDPRMAMHQLSSLGLSKEQQMQRLNLIARGMGDLSRLFSQAGSDFSKMLSYARVGPK